MAKVFIPQVGDKIELSQNWNCKISNERRNSSVFDSLGVDVSQQGGSNIDITFPKGTIFKVTRLYVRAPASSYDSLTLAVVSSPIKKLAKAKFWVKIMDANNMEFEAKEFSFNDFESISSLLRYLILQDGHGNDKNMRIEEKQSYLEQVVSHFSKPEKTISFDVVLNKNDILSTYQFKEENYSWQNNSIAYDAEVKKVFDLLPEEARTTITIYPTLNGAVYTLSSVASLKALDSLLGYLNQYSRSYYHKNKLGTYLSYDHLYFIDSLKKSKIAYVDYALTNKLDFNVGGNIQKIKNAKEFNKLMTSFMSNE